MGEEIIELSIEETNALRAKLGLKPLRGDKNKNMDSDLSMSVEESNDLRSRLGLKPLRTIEVSEDGRKASSAIHAPATNTREQDEVKRRLEEARLKREVEQGLQKLQSETIEEEKGVTALSWAEKMRIQSNRSTGTTSEKAKKKKSDRTPSTEANYTEQDFEDQNLIVKHSLGEFSGGTNTILTLADKTILEAEDDGENELENINMTESATTKDNLKRKRMMEMGIGHAGGYTGYDDDEFEELGGSQITLGISKNMGGSKVDDGVHQKGKTGFKLGSNSLISAEDKKDKNDVFASLSGQKMSLESEKVDVTLQTDFMTYEEEESFNLQSLTKDEIEKRRKKKEKKLMKKLKKEHKKLTNLQQQEGHSESMPSSDPQENGNLLEELVSNAKTNKKKRKRCREIESDDSGDEGVRNESEKTSVVGNQQNKDEATLKQRNEKYHKIMEKGNERTNKIFKVAPSSTEDTRKSQFQDEIDDDAFLNAALSKARRIQRLRELNKSTNSKLENVSSKNRGADAVIEALQNIKKTAHFEEKQINDQKGKKVVFDSGATTEFTRTLRSQNTDYITQHQQDAVAAISKTSDDIELKENDQTVENDIPSNEDDGETLLEMANQIQDDHHDETFASTANSFGVGRGMSAFLGILKQTGEINGKNGGKEELRGRAKDERTYEDYAPLDLKNVVKIDKTGLSGQPHEKDLEFANREVKLEYRDEHGRLLTRKEAYRQLCYQFHGHGASKKNEEKRLQQIERENKERSSKASTGTLQSLMATQKATGKAFVLHKT